jgi:hypothetical protein
MFKIFPESSTERQTCNSKISLHGRLSLYISKRLKKSRQNAQQDGKGEIKGGWEQRDLSLAWLEAAQYSSEGGHGTIRNRSVQEILCKMCITVLP